MEAAAIQLCGPRHLPDLRRPLCTKNSLTVQNLLSWHTKTFSSAQPVAARPDAAQHQAALWAVAAAVLPLLLHAQHSLQSAQAAAAAVAAVPEHAPTR